MDPDVKPRPTVSINQAAEICGVSRRTIYHWIRDSKVSWTRTPTGFVRIHRDTLLLPSDTPEGQAQNRIRSKLYRKHLTT